MLLAVIRWSIRDMAAIAGFLDRDGHWMESIGMNAYIDEKH